MVEIKYMAGTVMLALFFFFKQKTAYEIRRCLVGSDTPHSCSASRRGPRPGATIPRRQGQREGASGHRDQGLQQRPVRTEQATTESIANKDNCRFVRPTFAVTPETPLK